MYVEYLKCVYFCYYRQNFRRPLRRCVSVIELLELIELCIMRRALKSVFYKSRFLIFSAQFYVVAVNYIFIRNFFNSLHTLIVVTTMALVYDYGQYRGKISTNSGKNLINAPHP